MKRPHQYRRRWLANSTAAGRIRSALVHPHSPSSTFLPHTVRLNVSSPPLRPIRYLSACLSLSPCLLTSQRELADVQIHRPGAETLDRRVDSSAACRTAGLVFSHPWPVPVSAAPKGCLVAASLFLLSIFTTKMFSSPNFCSTDDTHTSPPALSFAVYGCVCLVCL